VQVDVAQQAAHHRAQDEAQAKGRAQLPVALRPLLGRRDVGHVGVGDGDVGLHRAAEQPHDDQHPQRRGHGRDEEAQRQAGEADQQHAAAAEAVGQAAQDGRGEEVGDAEGEGHRQLRQRVPRRRGREGAHQRRQHRNDEADGDHVDQHGQQDEAHARGTGPADGLGGTRAHSSSR
jgi:hypothetical protein